MSGRSRLGLVGLGVRRVFGRLTGPTPGRTLVCLFGVALAIAVLVVVTGLSLGLAGSATVESDDVNYWIVPEEEETGITPLAYEGATLGSVHDTAARLAEDDRIDHVSPVAIQPLRLDNPETGDREYVLALGVIPSGDGQTVAGIETDALDASYPYYADGGYDGTWTGELVVSPAVSNRLAVDIGDDLVAGSTDRPLSVVAIADEDPSVGAGEAPVVVVHLAELQDLTNTVDGDQADQILVVTDSDVRDDIEGVYPETSVVTRTGLFDVSVTPTNLPFAMAVGSGLVALGIGVAFVATMMGLELTATRQSLAILDAIGISRLSVALVLLSETVTIAVLGGLLGIGLGALGIVGVNAGIGEVVDLPAVATFEPVLVGYGLAAAVTVGVVSVLYPLYLARRTDTLAELTR